MKVCVMNFSGNVGKTTVAANLLTPRLGAQLLSVETINQDAEGIQTLRLRAADFEVLHDEMLLADDVVVDVGASNVETFLDRMEQLDQSQADYDYFVVPTVKDRKQTLDTIATIETLLKTGIDCERIRVLFNLVEGKEDVPKSFQALFGYAMGVGIELDASAALHVNPVFEMVKDYDMTLAEVIADNTDHKQLLLQETDDAAKRARLRRLSIKRLGTTCARDMDAAFAALRLARR